jgi:hypothetical protein
VLLFQSFCPQLMQNRPCVLGVPQLPHASVVGVAGKPRVAEPSSVVRDCRCCNIAPGGGDDAAALAPFIVEIERRMIGAGAPAGTALRLRRLACGASVPVA